MGGKPIQIEVALDGEIVGVRNDRGEPIPAIFNYWFAWQAFQPQTAGYTGGK